MPMRHSVLREGFIAGFIGATAVAIWFLVVDMIAGRPFATPAFLGRALTSVLGPIPEGEGPVLHIVLYTLFHYAAFTAVGIVAVIAVHWAETEPTVLAGFLILFVAMELAFYGLVALLSDPQVYGALAWYQVGAANLISAFLMGVYLWRTHPALRKELELALGGGE